MFRLRIKKSGQVILEAAIVFICLAAVAVASTTLFSNLNLNMLRRLDVYRQSRLDAVNNPSRLSGVMLETPLGQQSLSNPVSLLDYSPHNSVNITPYLPYAPVDWILFNEPRIDEANRLLERQNLIVDFIIPYKINQANYLARRLRWDAGEGEWGPHGYLELTQELVSEVIALGDDAYASFCRAIELYREALNNPTIPGPFDYEEEHRGNRQQLASTIRNLESSRPGLERWINDLKVGYAGSDGFLGLDYVLANIGSTAYDDKCDCEKPSDEHVKAVNTLGQAVDFCGAISSPVLADNLARDINRVYGLWNNGMTYNETTQAKDLSERIIAYPQAQNDPDRLGDTAQSLKSYLESALEDWRDDPGSRDIYLNLGELEAWALSEVAELSSRI